MTSIDFDSEPARHTLDRLANEQVIWLTTVNHRGQPQSSPVWFLWRDDGFDIFSQPDTAKVRSIVRHPEVSLNLNSSPAGEQVATFEGTAQIVSEYTPGTDNAEYVAKYSRLIEGWKPDDFARSFSTRIRVEPTRLRAH